VADGNPPSLIGLSISVPIRRLEADKKKAGLLKKFFDFCLTEIIHNEED
jgi:hypothetical protein